MKAPIKSIFISFLGLTLLTACGQSMVQNDCEATPNGLSFNYPCDSDVPTESRGGGVLTTWNWSEKSEVDGESVETSKSFQVERYASDLDVESWVQEFLKEETDPQALTVSGENAWEYVSEEGDEQVRSVVIEGDGLIYLARLAVAHPEKGERENHMSQLMDMLNTLELPKE